MQKIISEKELNDRLAIAKQMPGMAHLPSFGLVVREWNYEDAELLQRAAHILKAKGIEGIPYEAAPAVFWYRTKQGDIHCELWE